MQPLLHPGVHPKLLLKLRIFSKTWLQNGEKTSDQVCDDEIDQFYKYFLFLHATSFVIEENSPAMHGWRKIVFLKLHLDLFP